jgi:hypothetical protein
VGVFVWLVKRECWTAASRKSYNLHDDKLHSLGAIIRNNLTPFG